MLNSCLRGIRNSELLVWKFFMKKIIRHWIIRPEGPNCFVAQSCGGPLIGQCDCEENVKDTKSFHILQRLHSPGENPTSVGEIWRSEERM